MSTKLGALSVVGPALVAKEEIYQHADTKVTVQYRVDKKTGKVVVDAVGVRDIFDETRFIKVDQLLRAYEVYRAVGGEG